MAILSADLKFFAAQYASDDAYGGGPMSATVVQDGVASNVFPVAGESDMNLGRVQLRKVYAAVLSENTDQLVNASVNVYTPPSDAAYEFAMFTHGDRKTTRATAAAALARFPFAKGSPSGDVSGSSNPYTFTNATSLQVGDRLLCGVSISGQAIDPYLPMIVNAVAVVEAITGSSVTLSFGGGVISPAITSWATAIPHPSSVKVVGAAETTGAVAASDTAIPLNRLEARIIPDVSPYPLAPQGLDGTGLKLTGGMHPIFRPGEMVMIRNAAGSTSEVGTVINVDYFNGEIELASGLANSYASGSIVTSLLPLGDMQAQIGASFSQQTWTRTFSDTLIGNPIGANYDRTAATITAINEGAETERWALVFTNDTDFKLIGESLGQIAAGAIDTTFSPINPITNQPYFTIPAAGWGTGWQAGNVLRLNTTGARAPFWVDRTISPVPGSASDGAEIQMRGSY